MRGLRARIPTSVKSNIEKEYYKKKTFSRIEDGKESWKS